MQCAPWATTAGSGLHRSGIEMGHAQDEHGDAHRHDRRDQFADQEGVGQGNEDVGRGHAGDHTDLAAPVALKQEERARKIACPVEDTYEDIFTMETQRAGQHPQDDVGHGGGRGTEEDDEIDVPSDVLDAVDRVLCVPSGRVEPPLPSAHADEVSPPVEAIPPPGWLSRLPWIHDPPNAPLGGWHCRRRPPRDHRARCHTAGTGSAP